MCGWRRAELTSQYLLSGQYVLSVSGRVVVHALRVSTMVNHGRVSCLGIADKSVTVLGGGNGTSDFAAVISGIVHSAHGRGGIDIPGELDVGRNTGTARSV